MLMVAYLFFMVFFSLFVLNELRQLKQETSPLSLDIIPLSNADSFL